MKLPESKIELAAPNEQSRYVLSAVQLDVAGKRMMATDGHIGAIIPCEVSEGDQSALLSLESLKQIRAMQKRSKTIPIEIKTNGKVTATNATTNETMEFALVEGRFPNLDMVMTKAEGAATITLDVALLLRLAQALNPEATAKRAIVSLWIKDPSSTVGVRSGSVGQGVIMPCRPETHAGVSAVPSASQSA
jgi:DNA polymerase III beta subunit, central domain